MKDAIFFYKLKCLDHHRNVSDYLVWKEQGSQGKGEREMERERDRERERERESERRNEEKYERVAM